MEEISEGEIEGLNREAELYRNKRDELNSKVKALIVKRSELEKALKQKISDAVSHKNKRDKLNNSIKEVKIEKDKLLESVRDLSTEIMKIKKEILPTNNMTIGGLKKKLNRLEFKQMTNVLTPQQEREIIEEMTRLNKEIMMREDLLAQNSVILDKNKDIKKLKQQLKELSNRIKGISQEAQVEHEAMTNIFKEVDETRASLEGTRNEILKTRKEADKAHEEHIRLVERINELQERIRETQKTRKKVMEEKSREEIAKEADEIFARFQRGEKLSTEDLIVLQKAGIL
jgi:uncharacterized coiled-coil DUF342 family protein